MNRRHIKTIFCILFLGCVLSAHAKTGLKISFKNVVNGEPLVLNDRNYINANGDSFSVSTYKYYVSNISFISPEKSFNEPESYHLINEGRESSKEFIINNVPAGQYTSMRFLIGVDSLHNVSGAQSDALDPINAMFWDWNTGYIMAKIEGSSPEAEQRDISFHVGGFSGLGNTLRWVTINFPQPLIIKENSLPEVRLKSDVAEWFKTPRTIDFSKTPAITTEGRDAAAIADNYADMFTLDTIEE